MSDIRKLLSLMNESSAGTSVSGSVAPVAQAMTTERRIEEAEPAKNTPSVLEYGNWENSALTTSTKLKKQRAKAAKLVKSIYGEDTPTKKVEESNLKKKIKAKPIAESHLDEQDLIVNPSIRTRVMPGLIGKGSSRVDHEVQMAKGDLLQTAKNAAEIFAMIKDRSEDQGLEGWVQEKITKAEDYLNAVKGYLDSQQLSNESVDGNTPGTHMFASESGDTPGYIKSEEMKDKIAGVLIKLYDRVQDPKMIKKMSSRVAKHLGYDPADPVFQDAWASLLSDELDEDITEDELDEACWKGYHKDGNKKMFGKTYPNCVKNTNEEQEHNSESCPHCGGEMVSEELMNEKKDACYYKVKSRYKVWPSAYASGALVKCRKKGASNWGTKSESASFEGIAQVDENLHKWFKEKWVRFGPDGKIRGDCARGDDSEGKPKCLPQSKAQNLGKKGRASAASRKRREDPDPERRGPAKNVATKKKEQGVAEGSEQVYNIVAVDKSNAMSKPTKLTVKAGSIEEVLERLAINDWYPLEINGVEVINGKRLKKGVVEGSISDLLSKDPTSPKFNDHSAPRKTKHSGSTPTPYEQGRLDAHRKKSYNNIHDSEQDAEDYKTGYGHVKSRKQGVAEDLKMLPRQGNETNAERQKRLSDQLEHEYKTRTGQFADYNDNRYPSLNDYNTHGDDEYQAKKLKKQQDVAEGSMPYPHGKPEAGDKITWYHSNHYPKLEGKVVGWKDGHLIVQSVDPSPRNTEKTVAKYRVPKNNILSVEKNGVAEEASPMIKSPTNRFDNKQEAFAYAKEHGSKVFKSTYIDPNTGNKNITFVVKKEQGVAEARMSAAVRMQRAADAQRAKSDASRARTPSSIPKAEPKADDKPKKD